MLARIKSAISNPIVRRVKDRYKLIAHRGDKYECPFCGYKAKDLMWVGHDNRVIVDKHIIGSGMRQAGCFKCGSRDRERLLYAYFKEEMKILGGGSKDLRILHIAPEKGLTTIMLTQDYKSYVCGDYFTEGYNYYPRHVQNVNILDIHYNDNSFDLIICNHVLEHIEEDIKAMKELNRVLAKGGKAILQVPISANMAKTQEDFSIKDPKEKEEKFGQFDHVRIYGQDYVDRLKKAGFAVSRVNISNKYPKYGLNSEEDIFVCEKA